MFRRKTCFLPDWLLKSQWNIFLVTNLSWRCWRKLCSRHFKCEAFKLLQQRLKVKAKKSDKTSSSNLIKFSNKTKPTEFLESICFNQLLISQFFYNVSSMSRDLDEWFSTCVKISHYQGFIMHILQQVFVENEFAVKYYKIRTLKS